uniref:Protein THEM6 n=1 Tax=Rousettus aegyptiacus TaxID=9407 RepID=A0A7J8C4G4_ROUAE|nr:thioesterase superfamily member 6 [Rousettus aegyptiacus]
MLLVALLAIALAYFALLDGWYLVRVPCAVLRARLLLPRVRSLRLLEPFEVRTRLLGWDDRAFYLEARFISLRDGFVCALLRARHHVLGTSPERVVQHLCKRRVEPPELPEDLQHWIAYNEASSRLLRAESGLGHAAKEQ